MRQGLLLVVALACTLGPEARAACRVSRGCQYFLVLEGQFSEEDNLPSANLRVLNENFEQAVLQATKALGLKTSRDEKVRLMWKAHAPREDGRFFELHYRAGPGAMLEVSARSFSRPEGPWGRVEARIPIVPRAQWQVTSLKSKALRGTSQALEALEREMSGATPGRRLALSVLLNGLGKEERAYVENVLLPCLRSLYPTPVGSVPEVRLVAGYLEHAFNYLPDTEEGPRVLPAHLDLLQSATLSGECALGSTPLRRHVPEWTVDELNGGLRLLLRERR